MYGQVERRDLDSVRRDLEYEIDRLRRDLEQLRNDLEREIVSRQGVLQEVWERLSQLN